MLRAARIQGKRTGIATPPVRSTVPSSTAAASTIRLHQTERHRWVEPGLGSACEGWWGRNDVSVSFPHEIDTSAYKQMRKLGEC